MSRLADSINGICGHKNMVNKREYIFCHSFFKNKRNIKGNVCFAKNKKEYATLKSIEKDVANYHFQELSTKMEVLLADNI